MSEKMFERGHEVHAEFQARQLIDLFLKEGYQFYSLGFSGEIRAYKDKSDVDVEDEYGSLYSLDSSKAITHFAQHIMKQFPDTITLDELEESFLSSDED
ncbi:MAG: hypothetical protein KBD66_02820 [Candidatus Doudnabacteria bacterium]|nr:hypothetical protein [Candidatus Doudnabacteria bacterium]